MCAVGTCLLPFLLLNVVICLFKKVWFPEATICGAESSAKTWRERSDVSSCDRLDREETGARVSGTPAVSSHISH